MIKKLTNAWFTVLVMHTERLRDKRTDGHKAASQ